MLCATASMKNAFAAMPEELMWPSYRTPLTVAVWVVAVPISMAYLYVANFFLLRASKPVDAKNK